MKPDINRPITQILHKVHIRNFSANKFVFDRIVVNMFDIILDNKRTVPIIPINILLD